MQTYTLGWKIKTRIQTTQTAFFISPFLYFLLVLVLTFFPPSHLPYFFLSTSIPLSLYLPHLTSLSSSRSPNLLVFFSIFILSSLFYLFFSALSLSLVCCLLPIFSIYPFCLFFVPSPLLFLPIFFPSSFFVSSFFSIFFYPFLILLPFWASVFFIHPVLFFL